MQNVVKMLPPETLRNVGTFEMLRTMNSGQTARQYAENVSRTIPRLEERARHDRRQLEMTARQTEQLARQTEQLTRQTAQFTRQLARAQNVGRARQQAAQRSVEELQRAEAAKVRARANVARARARQRIIAQQLVGVQRSILARREALTKTVLRRVRKPRRKSVKQILRNHPETYPVGVAQLFRGKGKY